MLIACESCAFAEPPRDSDSRSGADSCRRGHERECGLDRLNRDAIVAREEREIENPRQPR